ncbi:hypothetical protein ACWDBW_15785 [Streptomyces sp. NPDC001107]
MNTPIQSAPVTLPSVQAAGEWQPRVIGLDLSLTSTGIAGTDWAFAARPGRRRAHERMDWLLAAVAMCLKDGADLVVVEGAAYAQGGQAGHHELAGLWWLVTQYLWRRRIPYAVANPHHRTIYATGRANPAQHLPRKERSRVAKRRARALRPGRHRDPRRDGTRLARLPHRAGTRHPPAGPGSGAVARPHPGIRQSGNLNCGK